MPSMTDICARCMVDYGHHFGSLCPGSGTNTFTASHSPPKFKVGDKVRCVNSDGSAYMLMIGSVYTVTSVRDPGYGTGVVLTLDANADTWRENRFELADAAPVAFKPGDLVRCVTGYNSFLRAGTDYTVLDVDSEGKEISVVGGTGIWDVERFVLVRRHNAAPTKHAEPDFSAEMAFFTRCEMPNCCAKCAAPTPCKYH